MATSARPRIFFKTASFLSRMHCNAPVDGMVPSAPGSWQRNCARGVSLTWFSRTSDDARRGRPSTLRDIDAPDRPHLGSGHAMTLAALHARFLQHCAVEKRLRPMTIKSYRSDFGLFLKFLRRRRSQTLSPPGRGQGEGPTLRTFTTAVIRDYQAHMATRSWSVNTVRRRLVELNRF